MSDLEFKRVVVACDAECETGTAVREAAALAAKWGVPVHGIFIENENLLRLAELPFSRQVSLSSPNLSESFTPRDIETLFSALAAGMRRALAAVAEGAGLDWSFAVVHDMASANAIAAGDMLVLEAGPRPFSGSWRPRSRWESAAGDLGRTVLLRRSEGSGRGRAVIVLAVSKAEHARTFAAVRALMTPRSRIAFIAIDNSDAETGAAETLAQDLASFEDAVIEHLLNKSADIGRRVLELSPGLVVIETAALGSEEVQAIVTSTRCDVLLVG